MSNYCVCEHCWNRSKIHFHALSERLVRSFMLLVSECRRVWFKVKLRDLKLNVTDNNNFQKLQYFWLVNRDEKWYIPTELWYMFAWWQRWVWSRVATLNNERLPNYHSCWDKKRDKFKPKKVFIQDVMPKEYMTREEYQRHSLIHKII